MSPRFVLRRENVPCVAEVVNRSLKADCTDFTSELFSTKLTDYLIRGLSELAGSFLLLASLKKTKGFHTNSNLSFSVIISKFKIYH